MFFFFNERKFIEQLPSAERCARFGENTSEWHYFACVRLSLRRLTFPCKPVPGRSPVRGPPCGGPPSTRPRPGDCFLMVHVQPMTPRGIVKRVYSERSKFLLPVSLSLSGASFPRDVRRRGQAVSQRHRPCTAVGRVDAGQSDENLPRGGVGHGLPVPGAVGAWPEVIRIPAEARAWSISGGGFSAPLFPGRRPLSWILGEALRVLCAQNGGGRTCVCNPLFSLWM